METRPPVMRTKIVATLGPACATPERLRAMCDAGLDVCRINFSHGDRAQHARLLELARSVAAEVGQPICVVGDLCGPKIRLGEFAAPVELADGATVRFARGDGPCTAERLTVTEPRFVDEVAPGHRILIDDGLVRLTALERRGDELAARVDNGGTVSSRKGVNLPDTALAVPALTEKDRADLDWAIERGLDYVALSFVRDPEDLYELRRVLKSRQSDVRVMIKIEKTQALWHLEELIANSDAVLVARGDLGVETELWRVPLIQKDVVAECQAAGVPVIVATQMLQSMLREPLPTRAEVSDVANAILDRADAVMLSGETAVGQHPVAAVDVMNRIASATEEYLAKRPPAELRTRDAAAFRPTAALAHSAVAAARDLGARLVAVWTATGKTVQLVAQRRLAVPVVALATSDRVCRQLNLLYGVEPIRMAPLDNPTALLKALDAELVTRGLAVPADLIVVVSSTHPTTPGMTNLVLVHRVGDGGGAMPLA